MELAVCHFCSNSRSMRFQKYLEKKKFEREKVQLFLQFELFSVQTFFLIPLGSNDDGRMDLTVNPITHGVVGQRGYIYPTDLHLSQLINFLKCWKLVEFLLYLLTNHFPKENWFFFVKETLPSKMVVSQRLSTHVTASAPIIALNPYFSLFKHFLLSKWAWLGLRSA